MFTILNYNYFIPDFWNDLLGRQTLKTNRDKFNRIIKTARVVIDKEQEDIDTIHEHRTLSKLRKILNDKTHPIYPIYIQQRIESSGRFRLSRTSRNMRSFFPTSIKFYKEDFNRVITLIF